MKKGLTADKVKKEICARIQKELKKTKATDLRRLIYEKPWCTGGKGEEVAINKLKQRDSHSK